MRKNAYVMAAVVLLAGACAVAGRERIRTAASVAEIESLRQNLHGVQKRLLTREQHLDELFDHIVLTRPSDGDDSQRNRTIEIWQRFDEMALLTSVSARRTEDVTALNRLAWFHLQRNRPADALSHLKEAESLLATLNREEPDAGYDEDLVQTYLHEAMIHQSINRPDAAVLALQLASLLMQKPVKNPSARRTDLHSQVQTALDALTGR